MSDQDILAVASAPKDLLTELVGEGKKYKTQEDLARGKLEADIHIKRLEEEAKALREAAAGAKSIDDILEAIKAKAALVETPPKNNDATEDEVLPPSGVSADQVAKIVAEQLKGNETARQKEANRIKSNDLMKKMFGDKAQEKFNAKATSPEVRAVLVQLAETSPEQFALLFKEQGQESLIDAGGRQSANLNETNSGADAEPGTQKFYAQLRKKNPKLYYAAATQLEMHNNALRDPQRYFGR
jgi:hypothetical protein